jgi:hypothetical protein
VGTRIKTNKGGKKGCRNKALSIAVLMIAMGMVLMGVSACKNGPRNVSCDITARDTTHISMHCVDKSDGSAYDDRVRAESDLYPRCQVGTYWPGCKGR